MEKVTRLMRVTSLKVEYGQTRVSGYFLEGHPNQTAQTVAFSFLTSSYSHPELDQELVLTIQEKPVEDDDS